MRKVAATFWMVKNSVESVVSSTVNPTRHVSPIRCMQSRMICHTVKFTAYRFTFHGNAVWVGCSTGRTAVKQ